MYFSNSVQIIYMTLNRTFMVKINTTDCLTIGPFLLISLKRDSHFHITWFLDPGSFPLKMAYCYLGMFDFFLHLTYQKYSFTPPYPTFFKFKVEEINHNVQDKEGNKNK